MSKKIFSIVLAVCMLLSAPLALAQEDYVPGQTIQSLLYNAFESGQIVGGDLKILFDMNLDVLDPSQEEERAQIDGVMQILEASTLSAGVGKIDGGYRIELSGEYAPSGKQSTSIDAAIELTREGVVVESDLIEGKRLSVTWESVLMMCGVPTDQIQQIMALRDMDLEALLDQQLFACLQRFITLLNQRDVLHQRFNGQSGRAHALDEFHPVAIFLRIIPVAAGGSSYPRQ